MEWLTVIIVLILPAVGFGIACIISLLARMKTAESQIQDLMTRLDSMEHRDAPVRLVKPVIRPTEHASEAEPIRVRVPEPGPEPAAPPAPREVIPEPIAPRIPEPPAQPGPTLGERIRTLIGDTEWEAFVGTSLLNKAGALVLVMGIALFLSYSFGHVGPWGRAIAAILGSIGLLGSGVWGESRSRFRVFARGLIGAGWAGLYASAYAIYAIPATKIIQNPIAGSVILFVVVCGMIAHSLRYRSEALTAVTYFAAFGALAISPLTPFAVLSLIPLSASLLYLAYRFQWFRMALMGVAATYLTCISRGDAHAPLAASQTLMLAFWILFETFDLMRMKRRAAGGGMEWIAPLNALGFLGISWHAWAMHAPEKLWLASAYAAALYLASTVARFVTRPPSSFVSESSFAERLRAGSFEGSALLSSVLAGLAIFGRSRGIWVSAELLVEAQLVYLAGTFLESAFLRGIGIGGFGFSLLQATVHDGTGVTVLGHSFDNRTPVAILHAAVFYLNREIRRNGIIFSSMAALLVASVIGTELKPEWIGTGLAFFGAASLLVGLRRQIPEYRHQGLVLVGLGFIGTAGTAIVYAAWMPIAFCLALSYALAVAMERTNGWLRIRESISLEYKIGSYLTGGASTALAALLLRAVVPGDRVTMSWGLLMLVLLELRIRRLPEALGKGYIAVAAACVLSTVMGYPGPLEHHPRPEVWSSLLIECLSGIACVLRLTMSNLEEERDALTLLAVAGTSALIWTLAPLPIVSVMWLELAIVMLEFARRFRSVPFGWIGTAEAALALCRICVADLENPDKWGHVPVAALTAGAFIAGLYFVYSQLGWLSWRRLARLTSWCAAALYAGITIAQANYNNYAVWWAGGMVALLLASRIFRENDFRYQACALSGLTLASTVLTNLSPVNLWVSIPVVTALYTSWFIVGRGSQKNLPLYFSGAGTVLMALVLYHAVSGSILTVAWGIEGAALLCAGFPLRDRVLRLQGLAAFLFCTLKLFFYDLRNLETPYRIVSFIALGGILLGVSWTYSRFREQLRRIL